MGRDLREEGRERQEPKAKKPKIRLERETTPTTTTMRRRRREKKKSMLVLV